MLVSLETHELVKIRYTWPEGLEFKKGGLVLKPKNTYLVVFSIAQKSSLEWFLEAYKDEVNILYHGKPAHNSNYPRTGPRNTLIIFEKKDE